MQIECKCWNCKRVFTIECDSGDYDAWKDGELIQESLHYLSADDRELLISNTCGECWDKMFGPSDSNE